jgi:hypothetical protein
LRTFAKFNLKFENFGKFSEEFRIEIWLLWAILKQNLMNFGKFRIEIWRTLRNLETKFGELWEIWKRNLRNLVNFGNEIWRTL